MKKKKVFFSVIFLAGSLVAGYVMFVAAKEIYRGRKIEREIERLEAEAQKIKADNENLREKITYLDTDQFREKVAKEKLNLKKEGEDVIEVRPSAVLGKESEENASYSNETKPSGVSLENYQKWWKQFFSY